MRERRREELDSLARGEFALRFMFGYASLASASFGFDVSFCEEFKLLLQG